MRPHKPLHILLVITIDLLLFGVLLLGYAFFHHVRTAYAIFEDPNAHVTYGTITKPITVTNDKPTPGTKDGDAPGPITVIVTDREGAGTAPVIPVVTISSYEVAYGEGLDVKIENMQSAISESLVIKIDGKVVSGDGAYRVDDEKGTVTIDNSCFKSLSKGAHTVSISLAGFSATAPITVDPYDRSGDFGGKFAELFSIDDEIYKDDKTYRSHDIYINQTYFEGKLSQRTKASAASFKDYQVSYYLYDVYVRNIENFYSSYSTSGTKSFEKLSDGLVLSMTGDNYRNAEFPKYAIRNGILLKNPPSSSSADVCVLFYDGVLKTYAPGTYKWDDIMALSPYQAWTFGPMLIDDSGNVPTSFNTTLWTFNPRAALGYVEPGHYVFLLVDGRSNNGSSGVNMETLATILHDHGCVTAYNFDGGASAQSRFNGEYFYHGQKARNIYDVLGIHEVE